MSWKNPSPIAEAARPAPPTIAAVAAAPPATRPLAPPITLAPSALAPLMAPPTFILPSLNRALPNFIGFLSLLNHLPHLIFFQSMSRPPPSPSPS